ncbi:hypothetical protein [Undibacterium umbellatum]|uniref:Uncharacterized protein n=1 Tax=Undibacterium umbellatum TaxID=2762300 RepID=A0ABR6ZJN7_9BURK|nr:hypothetical protein [Undibacterium umbellatum]MBC3911575.1 hypothetical protein [Undibacterium umbellatum]
MKQAEDIYTIDAFAKRGRGRPRKPDAKSDAQRGREYRLRRRAVVLDTPAYTAPHRRVLGPSDSLLETVLTLEHQRHVKRIKDIHAIASQIGLLEPIHRQLAAKGFVLPINDIKLRGQSLVVRETGNRSLALLFALIDLGMKVTSKRQFQLHTSVILELGKLNLVIAVQTRFLEGHSI